MELENRDALTPKLNPITECVINAMPFPTVPDKMKAVIAISQLITFASQFKRNILLWDQSTSVPINSISFVVAGSGAGKDSSVKNARKCFQPGYNIVEKEREHLVIQEAIGRAKHAGEELPEDPDVYRDYMRSIPPIDIMPTTEPGLIQHINDIGNLGISSGYLYSGEFADELAYNQDMLSNIKVLSETFDLGDKEAKYTKGAEFRSNAISGQPVSALFVGSPGHLLYDEPTKKKFNVAFMSKLARRSFFCYTPEVLPEPSFDSISEMLDYQKGIQNTAYEARGAMEDAVTAIANYGIKTLGMDIETSPEVFELFEIYKRYNSEVVTRLSNQESTYALIRRHLQWKALKLAGAFALLDQKDVILEDHYIQAIQFCELLDEDMELFEKDLNKSSHELFSDYIRTQLVEDGKAEVTVHDIKKLGFVPSVSKPKLQELVQLCAGYDPNGIYSVINDGGAIEYEPVIKTEVLGISFKPINITALDRAIENNDANAIRDAKYNIAATALYGFEVEDTTFAELGDLLQGSYAYSPFKYADGKRGKANILGGTKWLVLDVDEAPMSAEEAHFMLNDVNHHIALSSDPSNEYKYRILIELDSVVDINAVEWKHFYLGIAEELALKVDILPQSQIFFSYEGRKVYSQLEAEPLTTRDFVMQAKEKAITKEQNNKTTNAQKKALLNDPLETFNFAYEAPMGQGSRSLIRAAYYAIDLGATKEETLNLMEAINNYWQLPMEASRFEKILTQVTSMY